MVSVIIPTFNRRRQIGQAITSALNQSGVAVDVVVDDGSTDDGTVEIFDEDIFWFAGEHR